MAFNIFNKDTDNNIEVLKDKIPSVSKLAGLFGKKQSAELEKKEPEVPQAGGMEETANIFNMDYQEQKEVSEVSGISFDDVSDAETVVDLPKEPALTALNDEHPEMAVVSADDSVYDEFNFNLTLPQNNGNSEIPTVLDAEISAENIDNINSTVGIDNSQPISENIDAILDAPTEDLSSWSDELITTETTTAAEYSSEGDYNTDFNDVDIGAETSFEDGVAAELERLDDDPALAVLDEDPSAIDSQILSFSGETLEDSLAEDRLNIDVIPQADSLAENNDATISFAENDIVETSQSFDETNGEILESNEDVFVSEPIEDANDRKEPFLENAEDIQTEFNSAFDTEIDMLDDTNSHFDTTETELSSGPIFDDSQNTDEVSSQVWTENEVVNDIAETSVLDQSATVMSFEETPVAAAEIDERSGVYQEPIVRRDVEAPINAGYWNDAVSPFIKWYSGTATEKSFEVSKSSASVTLQGTDDCHSIHVNAGYNTYGWVVEFNNGKVMNLGDIKEFQLRKGYLPDTSGKISYGDLSVVFTDIDKITVYESVQYFSYGLS